MSTERQPGNYAEFAADNLKVNDGSAKDEAALILTVYDKLGLINPSEKEKLADYLPKDIAELHKQHGESLEPFLAVNLTPKLGLKALVAAFDGAYKGKHSETYYWSAYWDELDLNMLNRRTVGVAFRPIGQLSLRGAVMTADNELGEPGLTMISQTTDEQRNSARGMILHNQTDWLTQEALRREAGLPSLDKRTFTRFPQQDEIIVGGGSVVGCAFSYDSQAMLHGSCGWRCPFEGVRRSVGFDES